MCPNTEEPSKMQSRDATYRIQEGEKDGVSQKDTMTICRAATKASLKTYNYIR